MSAGTGGRDHVVAAAIPVEARPYQGRRAGIVSRLLAIVIDLGIVVVLLALVYVGWCALRLLLDRSAFRFPTPTFAAVFWVGAAILLVYLWAAWASTGRSYGASLLGLRVVDVHGRRVRPAAAFLRVSLYLCFPIGLFWCVFSRDDRSVQDLVVRTAVVYDWSMRRRPSRRDAPSLRPS